MKLRPTHKFTNDLIARGYEVVVGVDEVGRGCWAGPVTAAAVILPPKVRLTGARDSKLLTHQQRLSLSPRIKRQALAVGIGWASPAEIDEHGLTWAVRQSGIRALKNMDCKYDAVILDGNHNYLREHCYAETLIKADQSCLNVASASIIAKVARDLYMIRMHRLYPQFGFDSHKGYGTRRHLEAIKSGLSPLHRRLFKPIMAAVQNSDLATATAFYESLISVD